MASFGDRVLGGINQKSGIRTIDENDRKVVKGLRYWCVCVCELETLDLLKELRSCLRPSSMLLPEMELPEGELEQVPV